MLSFVVDKNFILQHMLKSFSDLRNVKDLKHKLWKRNPNLYYLLSQNIEPLTFSGNFSAELQRAVKNLRADLSSIYKMKLFGRMVREAERYRSFVAKQWEKNYKESFAHMENITRLSFHNIELNLKVYVSHPRLSRGRSYPERGIIAWSHNEDWKNYSTVYLWHEIMHHVLYPSKRDQNILHALIELSCDNELRIRLNKRGRYSKEGKYEIGHQSLRELENKILSAWRKYLRNPKINLYQFEKILRDRLPRKFLSGNSKLDRWAEWH